MIEETVHGKRKRPGADPVLTGDERYRALVEACADAVYSMSPDWRVMLQLHGKNFIADTPDPSSDWLVKYIHPDDRAQVLKTIEQAIRNKSAFELEHRVIRADGSPGWSYSHAIPLLDPHGEIVEWFGTAKDMTGRRQLEQELNQREAQLASELADTRLLQNLSAEIIRVENPQILYDKIIDASISIMGADFASMQMFHPERGRAGELRLLSSRGLIAEAVKHWECVRTDSGCVCGEVLRTGRRLIVPDIEKSGIIAGADLAIALQTGIRSIQSTPLYSRSGRLVGVISTHWRQPHQPSERSLRLLDILAQQAADLLERKQTEDALRESEARFRNIADHAPVMVWVTRPDARCTYLSASWYEFTGLAPDTGLGFGWIEAVHPDDRALAHDVFVAANRKREAFRLDYRLRRKDGVYRWAIDSASPRFSETGEFLGYIGSVIDITGRRELEIQTQLVADAMPALISYIDAGLKYRFNNKAYQEWFGYEPGAVLGRNVREVVGEAAYEQIRPHIETVLAGRRVRFEAEIAYKKIGTRNIIAEYVPNILPGGKVAGFYGLIHDITERKQLEEKTRHLARRLQLIADAMPALISYIDTGLRYRFNNKAYQDWFGYRPEDILGKTMQAVLGEAAFERLRPHVEAALAGQPVRFEGEIPYQQGGTRSILGEYVPDIQPDGSITGFYVLIQDISERKRSEKALEYHAREVESLLNASPLGVYLIDADFRIRELNPVALPVFDNIPGGVLGRDADEIIHILWEKKYADEVVGIFRHTLETGEPYVSEERAEYRIDLKKTEYYEWRLDRITLPDGRYGVVCYFRDISEQVKARKEIERSRDALREADRRKDEFLATLSHELRNPLAPIRQAAKLLQMPDLNERDAQWARDVIERQVGAMGWLLDDLLELSRISSGKLELRKEPVDFGDIVKSALELSRPLIEAKHHTLHVELPASPLRLVADPLRLAQIISNLLTNAAKYTHPRGQISLRAGQKGEELVIRVADNGIGINADMLPKIFDMFSQAVPALERTEGGLGVGLALVRGFVALHGGSVKARSEGPGRGSEFTVRLPLGAVPTLQSEDRAAPDTRPAHALKVLVVDDNQDTAETLAMLIRLQGHEVRTSFTGGEALATAGNFYPDIALLDIGMPELNGYEIAQHIRKKTWGEHMTLIAVTGWGQEDDRRRAITAGFDYHLRKPIDPDFLKSLLKKPGTSGHPQI